jgi:hypothetical protein
VLLAVNIPRDLEIAYNVALAQEEVADGMTPMYSSAPFARRTTAVTPSIQKQADDPMATDSTVKQRQPEYVHVADEKILALRNYRRAKGLCFTSENGGGPKITSVCQLFNSMCYVQEMVELYTLVMNYDHTTKLVESVDNMQLMQIRVKDCVDTAPEGSIVLNCIVNGKSIVFLLDSSSSNSFMSSQSKKINGHIPLQKPHGVFVDPV